MPIFSPNRSALVCSTPREGFAVAVERALPAEPGYIDAVEVTNRLRFEQRLAGLSAKFINLPADQVDQEIEIGLRVLTEALDADRTTVAQIDLHSGDFVVTHSHTSAGIPSFPHRVVKGVLPWLESTIMNGQIVATAHPEELPAEAQHEREYMKAVGEKSAIVVPFHVGGRVMGGMSIDSFRQYRRWDDAIISRVQDVADIFASALARKQADQELENAYSEIQRLKQQLETENTCLREEIGLAFDHSAVVGSSPGIRSVLKNAEQVAPTNSVALILGETGTGKELIARTIHDLSQRKSHPMVKVNCAALPTSLIESELFGRERGAYTGALAREIGRFELAHNSTIFLDEIGELPIEVQSKLLRVLQEGEFERLGSSKTISVDVRVIAATGRNLQAMVDQGRFREDLFYRLNVFPIEIPPLRERAEDIPALVWHLLKDLGKRMGRKIEGVHASTMQEFQKYGWPGNVRELRNVIERNLILNTGTIFRAKIQELEPGLHRSARRLDEVETEHLRAVLQSTRWRIRGKGGAAEIIGLKPTTLEAKMKKLGIRRPS
jgi:formate hydrogenlyase transcriptional activator